MLVIAIERRLVGGLWFVRESRRVGSGTNEHKPTQTNANRRKPMQTSRVESLTQSTCYNESNGQFETHAACAREARKPVACFVVMRVDAE